MRIILYTGKGGVGKTSIAAATALLSAEMGKKTIALSTDPAHSLADSFGLDLGPEPSEVRENLWAQEIDTLHEAERSWGKIQDYLTALMSSQKLGSVSVEELTVFPGMEELFGILQILRHHTENRYDVMIVDCAPTGETLRFLSYPDVLGWWLERIFPIQRGAIKVMRPIAQPLFGIPLPGDEVLASVERLFKDLQKMHDILADTATCSVRLVLNPEKMVIQEACRSYTYLNLFGFGTDAIVVNRLIPSEVDNGFLKAWKQIQGNHMRSITESFHPLPVLKVPLFDQEVVGFSMLKRMGQACFGDMDPTLLLYEGRPQAVTKLGNDYVLSIALPFVNRSEISLTRRGDELTIRVGEYKRNVILPRTLVGLATREATFEGETLKIRFGGVRHEGLSD